MAFTCPACQRTSHHPADEWYGWCSACNDYTEPRTPCHISEWHGRHTWHPSLVDLDSRAIHMRLDVDLICPGFPKPIGVP